MRTLSLRSPIFGRGDGFKSREVWVRVPPQARFSAHALRVEGRQGYAPRPGGQHVGSSNAARRGWHTGSADADAKVHGRLNEVQDRLRRARAEQRVLEEQVAYLAEVEGDAETRKLVAQTPLADREWREAKTDLDRHARSLEDKRAEVTALERERDRLLDQLLEAEDAT